MLSAYLFASTMCNKQKQELLLLVVVDQMRDQATREKTHHILTTSFIIMYHQKEKSQERNDSISSPPFQNKYRQKHGTYSSQHNSTFLHHINDNDVTKHFTSLYTDSYPATQLISLSASSCSVSLCF